MKYYLLNKEECKKSIWKNPILVKTKSMAKIKKINSLQKKLDSLLKSVQKELKESNVSMNPERLQMFLKQENLTEITKADFNTMYVISLYDTQEQRIKAYNKTEILKGYLFGDEIR